MATHYPVSIVTHELALNIAVQSYNGALEFGLIMCRRAMPDVRECGKLMSASHQELMSIVQASIAKKEPKRAAKPVPDGKPVKQLAPTKIAVKSNGKAPSKRTTARVKSSVAKLPLKAKSTVW